MICREGLGRKLLWHVMTYVQACKKVSAVNAETPEVCFGIQFGDVKCLYKNVSSKQYLSTLLINVTFRKEILKVISTCCHDKHVYMNVSSGNQRISIK